MYIEQLHTKCLSQMAYYVESNGEAIVIDPMRDTEEIEKLVESRGATIKYILETHCHADFVSSHVALSEKFQVPIVFGPHAQVEYPIQEFQDKEELSLGNITIRVLHTPGHTPESSSFLVLDENGIEKALFTGDTLFLGDVGRPDLAVSQDISKEDLAKQLYQSIYNKIMLLSDNVIVYPGHGKGSACGKSMENKLSDTLGRQRNTNYALQNLSEKEFVEQVLSEQSMPPIYFSKNATMNKKTISSAEQLLEKNFKGFGAAEFKEYLRRENVYLIDTRNAKEFRRGFVPGSINIGSDGQLASWVGSLLSDVSLPILLISDMGEEKNNFLRLTRVGCDNIKGYLQGGFLNWEAQGYPVDYGNSLSAKEFVSLLKSDDINVIDVRSGSEYEKGSVEKGRIQNIPLTSLEKMVKKLNPSERYYVHCAGGYRSSIGMSLLKRYGISDVWDVQGGFQAVQAENQEV